MSRRRRPPDLDLDDGGKPEERENIVLYVLYVYQTAEGVNISA